MEMIIEFLKEIISNPSIRRTTLTLTITFTVLWFVYQTIVDTSVRKNKNKYRKSIIGQLITGKSPKETNRNQYDEVTPENKIKGGFRNNDVEMDAKIIQSLRNKRYLNKNDEFKLTSRGYKARDTYEDLRRIISYSNEIKKFVKDSEGGMKSQSISSFRVNVIGEKIEIKSLTIPPITISTKQAMSIDDIDSLKGIINDNRILSAFAFDAQK